MSSPPGQLNQLKKVPKSNKLGATINEFPGMIGNFIQKWLENWTHMYQFIWNGSLAKSVVPVKYILIATQKNKAIELQKKLDTFIKRFDRDLLMEI